LRNYVCQRLRLFHPQLRKAAQALYAILWCVGKKSVSQTEEDKQRKSVKRTKKKLSVPFIQQNCVVKLNIRCDIKWFVLTQFVQNALAFVALANRESTAYNIRFCEMAADVIVRTAVLGKTVGGNPNCVQLSPQLRQAAGR
jgi:hypothetical protein